MTELRIEATRGDLVESVHRVSLAVVGSDGRLVASAGDPSRVAFWRSSAKPFQAMPLVDDGAADALGITPAELALACASHSSEPRHLEVAAGLLRRIGAGEEQLACGPHPPISPAVAARVMREGISLTPIWSNCSGKHAGMLALARHHRWPWAGYERPGHPVQDRVLREVARWTGIRAEAIPTATDGCAVVTFGLPLSAMAAAWARLGVEPAEGPRRIREAMTAHPDLVAGTGRLCTDLMGALPGRILAKIGAAGVSAPHFPSSASAWLSRWPTVTATSPESPSSQRWPLSSSTWAPRAPTISVRSPSTGPIRCPIRAASGSARCARRVRCAFMIEIGAESVRWLSSTEVGWMAKQDNLDPQTRDLVRFAAAIAQGYEPELRERVGPLRSSQVPAQWVEELLLQSVLMVGYPRALVAFAVWRRFSGVPAPATDEGQDYGRVGEWIRRGEEVCATVYGENYGKLRESVRALHPAVDAWMVSEGYGRTLGRPGLDLMRRELCTVAQTAVLETPKQLHSHLRGALNAGASFGQIEGVLSIVNPLLSFDQWKKIKELWRTVREGWSPGN